MVKYLLVTKNLSWVPNTSNYCITKTQDTKQVALSGSSKKMGHNGTDGERSETEELNELEGGCRSRTERRSGGTNCSALKFPSRTLWQKPVSFGRRQDYNWELVQYCRSCNL